MAQNVIINGVVYQSVPQISVPLSGSSGTADFYDTSDATLDSGNKMLSGYSSYSNGVKFEGSIASKTSSDMTANGATVTAPAGYYSQASSKSVSSGSATTPVTTITVTPSISVNSSTGLITATNNGSQSITPTVSAGYISAGTSGTVSVSGSDTEQLSTKAAETITPTTSDRTISAGQFLIGAQTIKGDSNLVSSNIKSGISIFGIAGSLTSATVSQDSVTKILSIS